MQAKEVPMALRDLGDRRQFRRFETSLRVRYDRDGSWAIASTQDISQGGMSLAGASGVVVGDVLRFALHMIGEDFPIGVEGEILGVRSDAARVQFAGGADGVAERVRQIVDLEIVPRLEQRVGLSDDDYHVTDLAGWYRELGRAHHALDLYRTALEVQTNRGVEFFEHMAMFLWEEARWLNDPRPIIEELAKLLEQAKRAGSSAKLELLRGEVLRLGHGPLVQPQDAMAAQLADLRQSIRNEPKELVVSLGPLSEGVRFVEPAPIQTADRSPDSYYAATPPTVVQDVLNGGESYTDLPFEPIEQPPRDPISEAPFVPIPESPFDDVPLGSASDPILPLAIKIPSGERRAAVTLAELLGEENPHARLSPPKSAVNWPVWGIAAAVLLGSVWFVWFVTRTLRTDLPTAPAVVGALNQNAGPGGLGVKDDAQPKAETPTVASSLTDVAPDSTDVAPHSTNLGDEREHGISAKRSLVHKRKGKTELLTTKADQKAPARPKKQPPPPPPQPPPAAEANPHYREGVSLLRQNKVMLAITELEAAIADNPDHAKSLLSLGLAYKMVGRRDKAIAAFERFLIVAPEHQEAPKVRAVIESLRK